MILLFIVVVFSAAEPIVDHIHQELHAPLYHLHKRSHADAPCFDTLTCTSTTNAACSESVLCITPSFALNLTCIHGDADASGHYSGVCEAMPQSPLNTQCTEDAFFDDFCELVPLHQDKLRLWRCESGTCVAKQSGVECESSYSQDCLPFEYCNTSSNVCTPRASLDASCSPFTNRALPLCESELQCVNEKCYAKGLIGEPCQTTYLPSCVDGARCDATLSTCVPSKVAGDACTSTFECVDVYGIGYCSDRKDGVCQTGKLGDACGTFIGSCQSAYDCVDDECVAPVSLFTATRGQSCASSVMQCAAGLWCNQPTGHVCQFAPTQPVPSTCTNDSYMFGSCGACWAGSAFGQTYAANVGVLPHALCNVANDYATLRAAGCSFLGNIFPCATTHANEWQRVMKCVYGWTLQRSPSCQAAYSTFIDGYLAWVGASVSPTSSSPPSPPPPPSPTTPPVPSPSSSLPSSPAVGDNKESNGSVDSTTTVIYVIVGVVACLFLVCMLGVVVVFLVRSRSTTTTAQESHRTSNRLSRRSQLNSSLSRHSRSRRSRSTMTGSALRWSWQ